jgi:hypothetical protein
MAFLRKAAGLVFIAMLVAGGSGAAAQSSTGSVTGTVTAPAADGQPSAMPGVTLTLSCTATTEEAAPRVGVSDEQGTFRFTEVPPGVCALVAELQGFKSATRTLTVAANQPADAPMRLELDAVREEVNVTARSDAAPEDSPARVERMGRRELQTAPIANERFQDALPLIPGVVRGPDGLLNINGTRSNQSALTFNNANATDPVTGEHAIEVPLDAISSVQVRGTAYAPEFGQSAGAVTTVETQRGGDAWHVQLNDLEPRVRRRGGQFVGIESFTPRFTVGGPIVKGKVGILESVQYQFTRTQVYGLPPDRSDVQVESVESFTRLDWNVNPVNHVTGSATVSPRKVTHAGLNTFNPQPVTPDVKNDGVLASAADQIVVSARALFESRVSVKQFDATIWPSQGDGVMILAPDVNAGSYFNDQDRTSRRYEWLNSYSFTPFGPSHLLKAAAGVTYEAFDGTNASRPVEIVDESGALLESIAFTGNTALRSHKTMVVGYAQDAWTVRPRVTLQYGVRYDHDSITGDANLAPRGSFTAALSRDGRTVLRGGAGIFYDPLPLNVAAFDQIQDRIVTDYTPDAAAPDAGTIAGTPVLIRNVVAESLRTPRSTNWNIEIDREWIKNLYVRVGYRQRENRFEPVVDPVTRASGEPVLELRSDGESRYRETQVTTRYQFHGPGHDADQIVASYTRSSAVGNLNDFNSFFGNIENPVIRPDARAPLPWDAPNRYLFWGNVSLPYQFGMFAVLDVRDGFPYSVVDAARDFVGARNEAGRYPTFLSLDTQVTKRFRLFGHKATIGLKVFNITNHFNPRDFQGNLASSDFGGFRNGVGRTFRAKWIYEF